VLLLGRFGTNVRFDRLRQHGTHPRRGRVVEAVDHEDALDHVGSHVLEGAALEPHRDHGAARVAADRADSAGDTRRAAKGRDGQPGRPRRGAQTTSRLAEEESARFHPTSIARGYDSHAGGSMTP
jgi:hypothetical protein